WLRTHRRQHARKFLWRGPLHTSRPIRPTLAVMTWRPIDPESAHRIENEALFDAFDFVLDVPNRVDVRRDRGDPLVDEELHHLRFRAGLPADTGRDIVFAAGLDRLADEFEHCGVEFVETVCDLAVVSVHGEGILGEVVSAEGGEVDAFFCHLLDTE